MKKVLLVSNLVFHYRIRIYNYFNEEFEKSGYEFRVITNKIQKGIIEPNFKIDIAGPSFFSYLNYIRKYKPDYVITFLHLKNFRIFPITYFCKTRHIPVIYWNHGINLKTQHNKFKNRLYYHLHDVSDAIILYSSNEKRHIVSRNQPKVFIANNTLNLEDLNFNRDFQKDYRDVYTEYGIREPNIVLFCGTDHSKQTNGYPVETVQEQNGYCPCRCRTREQTKVSVTLCVIRRIFITWERFMTGKN